MESIFKAVANNYRIRILLIISKYPGATVEQISQRLELEFNNSSSHIRKLNLSGLVYKKYLKNYVCHYLTQEGIIMIQAINLFYNSME